ncbi:hypothetical protein OG2516_08613 [Oceanicola granulosus HTCC2516]|uniref:Uncharacterized protein n=1 Tax=Oceanicola granulosus (strain ATCC BAA-861 / DSM 15982 / KCTC 12143 / HTCC2516) TaxID=314256 RepID=Q2CAX3_OCEGH|nr:DUF898 family protein [Oceanicola granulosus]EAR49803.1 hypothetical protein OG2516_08613 [Oceanicola granulosus HTCC2516]
MDETASSSSPGDARSTTWPGGAPAANLPALPPPPPGLLARFDPAADSLAVECVARRRPLFWLALRTGALTVLTLGLYRFWMKTRLRRWYWSSVRPGGLPLEYVGLPGEKLLGFLVAVVILAFYIGLVNLVLVFASFSLFEGSVPGFLLSFVGVIPLWFYARYRARRYVLARSRWRGVRSGLLPGAWGYALLAMRMWAGTLLSLGLLWPRMTFRLEKYRTDRTTFGSVRLHQQGDWHMLWPAFAHLAAAAMLSLAAGLVAGGGEERFLWFWAVTLPWLGYGLVRYLVEAKRLMADAKRAGPLGLVARPKVRRVLLIYLLGYAAAALALALPAVLLAILAYSLEVEPSLGDGRSPTLLAAGGFLLYVSIVLLWGTLRHVFVTMPLWRHYARTLTITGTASLPEVRQQARDEFAEAEGFAEALDVGAAI